MWRFRVEKGESFTIREAKWAARLWAILKDTERLSWKASQYAPTELLFELIGRPFDSPGLDKLLMGLPMPLTADPPYFLPLLTEEEGGIEQVKELRKRKERR